MFTGTCHCGDISFQLKDEPAWLTVCNCSYCRRTGALWAHTHPENVILSCTAETSIRYMQGDRTLAFVSCRRCGATTHWEPLDAAETLRMAVNMKMADPHEISHIRIRHFDGADSWEFLD